MNANDSQTILALCHPPTTMGWHTPAVHGTMRGASHSVLAFISSQYGAN
jgi:hypothetical protein